MPKPRQAASQKNFSRCPGGHCILRTVAFVKVPDLSPLLLAVGSWMTSPRGSNMEAETALEAEWSWLVMMALVPEILRLRSKKWSHHRDLARRLMVPDC